jgi:L-lactate utilization protein LutB
MKATLTIGYNWPMSHIACMGIEKINTPAKNTLGFFCGCWRVVRRVSQLQLIRAISKNLVQDRRCTSVLVDNGRSERLKCEDFRNALKMYPCGACMNTCPGL